MIKNKKALSPLVATFLLVIFALVIGAITMNWGKAYVEKASVGEEGKKALESAVIISISDIDNELKMLQIDYITGRINQEEYLQREKELLVK